MINKTSPIPFYFQIASQLREDIHNGKYAARERLPSENELAETFNVSRVTIRQALNELEKQNYIYREQGKGSFVSPVQVKGKFGFGSFTERVLKMGYTPSSKVLDFKPVNGLPRELIEMLQIPGEEAEGPFVCLRRVRYIDQDPVALEQVYLPTGMFPGIETLDVEGKSLYEELILRWGAQAVFAETIIAPTIATADQARHLETVPGDALLLSCQRVWSQTQHVLEYTHSYYTRKFALHFHWERVD
jgi:GntR family transcriptional regulator